jgi:Flp pilus assembly protein TadB
MQMEVQVHDEQQGKAETRMGEGGKARTAPGVVLAVVVVVVVALVVFVVAVVLMAILVVVVVVVSGECVRNAWRKRVNESAGE